MTSPDHAKDRAEARRRNRLAAKERAAAAALGITPETPAATSSPATGPATTAATGGLGLRAALRSSAGRAPIRADLAYLPTLVRTRAVLLPLLVVVVTTVVALQPGALASNIAQLVVQQIVSPPAFFVVFIGGMMTRRGAWMLGGMFSVFAYAASAIIGSSDVIAVLADGNPVKESFKAISSNVGNVGAMFYDIYSAIAFGIVVGAFAGWYSRFLRAMSPNQPTERDRRRIEAERRKGKR